jgi:predicted ABC-type ATPase
MGGHDIPEIDIRRRFRRSRENFFTLYKSLADEFTVFDNSVDDIATVIAQGRGDALTVLNSEKWQAFNLQNPAVERF